MGLKCSIVGLPNVGKSTLFNSLTNLSVKTANYPFCTVKPNCGVAFIPDNRIKQLAILIKPQRVILNTVEFFDIAGLVKDSSKGAGLGNNFLNNIRNTEAICHVVRCFENDNVSHITEIIDPKEDIDIINTELALSDLEMCEKSLLKIQKQIKNNVKNMTLISSVLNKCMLHLSNVGNLRNLIFNNEEKKIIDNFNFLTLKPMIYIANIGKNSFKNNSYFKKVQAIAIAENSLALAICAVIKPNINISNLKKEQYNFSAQVDFKKSKLNDIIQASYKLLNLQTYFTIGIKEIRAWAIPIGATVLEASGKIHTDFRKGLIRAHIITFKDFIKYKGEKGAKEAGKIRSEGKNYIIKDGDIIKFLFKV